MLPQRVTMMDNLLATPELVGISSKAGKAQTLVRKYHFTKDEIITAGVCTRQSYLRGLQAMKDGRDVGCNGHPRNLSDKDEEILAHWISELLDQGEIVYPWKLISLVCSFFQLLSLLSLYRPNIFGLSILHKEK